jgi:hypothetical protein
MEAWEVVVKVVSWDPVFVGKVSETAREGSDGDAKWIDDGEKDVVVVALDFLAWDVEGLGGDEVEVVVVVVDGMLKGRAGGVLGTTRSEGKGFVDDGVVVVEEIAKGIGEEGGTKHGSLGGGSEGSVVGSCICWQS